jgi:hypothetical protein
MLHLTEEVVRLTGDSDRSSVLAVSASLGPNNALSLEYERLYGLAGRNVDVSYFVNHPDVDRPLGIFGLRLEEEAAQDIARETRPAFDDRGDLPLVGFDPVEPLA